MKLKYLLNLLLLLNIVFVDSTLAQNTAETVLDSVQQKFTYYDFFKKDGLQIETARTKKSRQSVIITHQGNHIKSIRFNYEQRSKYLYVTDSVKRDGYTIFLSRVTLDGDYESLVFMSEKMITSFTYYTDSRRKAFMYSLLNEKDSIMQISGWIDGFDFKGIIDALEKNNFDISNCKFCNYLTRVQRVLGKPDLADGKKMKNYFLMWYSIVF